MHTTLPWTLLEIDWDIIGVFSRFQGLDRLLGVGDVFYYLLADCGNLFGCDSS